MPVELDAASPVLVGLLIVLLGGRVARRFGVKAWLLLAAVAVIGFVANPNKASHVQAVARQAGVEIRGTAGPICAAMIELRNGSFASMAEYSNFGVASVVTLHSRIVSVGVLGKVWTVNLNWLAHSTRS